MEPADLKTFLLLVYLYKDSAGKTIYIGKAKSLKNRLTTYCNIAALPARLQRMVHSTARVELITFDRTARRVFDVFDFEPVQAATVVRLDRDICLVVDRSGSSAVAKWLQPCRASSVRISAWLTSTDTVVPSA